MINLIAVELPGGTIRADLSADIIGSIRWSRGEHGARSIDCEIAASGIARLDWLKRVGNTELRLRSQYGEVLAAFRLAAVRLTDWGVRLTGYGYWDALNDLLYTALWSDAGPGNWVALVVDDVSTAVLQKFTYDQWNRLYVAPNSSDTYRDTDIFAWGFRNISGGARQIIELDFDYVLDQDGDADWRVSVDRCDSAWAVLGNIGTITADGSGTKNYTFTGCDYIAVSFYRNNVTPAAITNDTGSVYFKMTNIYLRTASTVSMAAIVAALATYTNATNTAQLSSVTALVNNTSDTLENYRAEDDRPAAMIDDLLSRSAQTGTFYEAGVNADRRLYLRSLRSQNITRLATIGELEAEADIDRVYNRYYAKYPNATGLTTRTATASNTPSIALIGMTRDDVVDANDTTASANATGYRDDALAYNSSPPPVLQMRLLDLRRVDGAPDRLYALQPGDTLRIDGVPFFVSSELGDIIVSEVVFDTATGTAEIGLVEREFPLALRGSFR